MYCYHKNRLRFRRIWFKEPGHSDIVAAERYHLYRSTRDLDEHIHTVVWREGYGWTIGRNSALAGTKSTFCLGAEVWLVLSSPYNK